MKKIFVFVVILLCLGLAFSAWFILSKSRLSEKITEKGELISQVDYLCQNNQTIGASYFKGEEQAIDQAPQTMPTPTGRVSLILSDGRIFDLAQTISASGIRYANQDETIIFWSKGEMSFLLENDLETYSNCLALSPEKEGLIFLAKNCSYLIEQKEVRLTNGLDEAEILPDSVSKITTRYFGNEAFGDFNNDGLADIAFLLTRETGGSGNFYYLALILSTTTESPCLTDKIIFLGDRIAPQTTESRNNQIIVNYVDRAKDEPMTTDPSIGISRFFEIKDGSLIEVNKSE